jgi:hypothetical protein
LSEEGSQFGPVARAELDKWFTEGRVTAKCQLLREGAAAWQWASELFPTLAAPQPAAVPPAPSVAASQINTQPNPYAAPASPAPIIQTSPQRKISARFKRSDYVNIVGLWNYALAGLITIGAMMILINALYASSSIQQRTRGDLRELSAGIGIFGAVIAFFFLLMALPFFLAGLGVMKRAQWGRILTIVMGAFTAVGGLVMLGFCGLTLLALATVPADAPKAMFGRVAITGLVAFLFVIGLLGHAIYSFIVLLRPVFSREFVSNAQSE